MRRDEIPTPALLLDLDRFERNLARMAAHVRAAGKHLRPHAKTHRCPEIARRQIAAGALGVACAKLGEAEVMARAGIRGLLITTPVVPEAKIQRFIELVRAAPDTMVVMDNAENATAVDRAAAGRGRDRRRAGRHRRRAPGGRASSPASRRWPWRARSSRRGPCACAACRATRDTAPT